MIPVDVRLFPAGFIQNSGQSMDTRDAQQVKGSTSRLGLVEWQLLRLVSSRLPSSPLLHLSATCTAAASADLPIDLFDVGTANKLPNPGPSVPSAVVGRLVRRVGLIGLRVSMASKRGERVS